MQFDRFEIELKDQSTWIALPVESSNARFFLLRREAVTMNGFRTHLPKLNGTCHGMSSAKKKLTNKPNEK